MTAVEQVLIDKIKQLPPRRMAEVEDFVDFLRTREDEHRLSHAAAKASEALCRPRELSVVAVQSSPTWFICRRRR